MVSKRYNQFNNKGGNKQANKGGPKKKCLPFECIARWLGRLSCWHTGLADDYFHDLARDVVEWTPYSKTIWNSHTDCYEYTDEARRTTFINEPDMDWELMTEVNELAEQEDDDDLFGENFHEDISWICMNDTIETWTITETGAKTSTRCRYQSKPVLVY